MFWFSLEHKRWRMYMECAERMYRLNIEAGLEPVEALKQAWDFVLKLREAEFEN